MNKNEQFAEKFWKRTIFIVTMVVTLFCIVHFCYNIEKLCEKAPEYNFYKWTNETDAHWNWWDRTCETEHDSIDIWNIYLEEK